MGEVCIDVEGVRDGPEVVKIVVDHDPLWIWVRLNLVTDDGRPSR